MDRGSEGNKMTTQIEMIKRLREETGAGIMDCRKALESSNGSYDGALVILREQAEAIAAKRANRPAEQGRIELYSHANGRIGVMVEVNVETDFAERSEVFRKFTHEIALQIAASAPVYVQEEDVPAEILAEETQKAEIWARQAGKPDSVVPRMIEGALKKFLDEQVLVRQPYIRDETLTVGQLLNQTAASVGEKITIRRIARWELEGEQG
jgi:elongation factor Ts